MLLLALVHSYKNYGKVQVDCLEGCRCARQGVCALARLFRGGGALEPHRTQARQLWLLTLCARMHACAVS